jgi:diadenosine tetraphosphatase ApaH/serine/threonine PP2A family protein phosphatase
VRVAVLSDIHANLVALDAVLATVGTVDAIWHLGDVVGYGPEPDGVVARLSGLGAVGVAGNHDLAAVGGDQIEWFNPDARAAMEWTRRRISPTTRQWLTDLPSRRRSAEFSLVHASERDPVWEYVTSVAIARANLAVLGTRYGLHGHTHLPMVWTERDGRVEAIAPRSGATYTLTEDRALLNPGSVGQARDGDPTAGYLVIDADAGLCTWRRVAYDIPAVQAAMIEAGLPRRLADRLGFGL